MLDFRVLSYLETEEKQMEIEVTGDWRVCSSDTSRLLHFETVAQIFSTLSVLSKSWFRPLIFLYMENFNL